MMTLVSIYSSIVVVLMVIKVNMTLEDKFDIVETLVAMFFGWLGALYILITYFDDVTTTDIKKEK